MMLPITVNTAVHTYSRQTCPTARTYMCFILSTFVPYSCTPAHVIIRNILHYRIPGISIVAVSPLGPDVSRHPTPYHPPLNPYPPRVGPYRSVAALSGGTVRGQCSMTVARSMRYTSTTPMPPPPPCALKTHLGKTVSLEFKTYVRRGTKGGRRTTTFTP